MRLINSKGAGGRRQKNGEPAAKWGDLAALTLIAAYALHLRKTDGQMGKMDKIHDKVKALLNSLRKERKRACFEDKWDKKNPRNKIIVWVGGWGSEPGAPAAYTAQQCASKFNNLHAGARGNYFDIFNHLNQLRGIAVGLMR